MERYARQIALPMIGEEGQQRLLKSRVLVVGAGGLGSPVLLYLCAAGVGALGIADGDRVCKSNLNRQILYGAEDVGRSKSEAAKAALLARNPDVRVKTYGELDEATLRGIAGEYDAVVDCVDATSTRLWVQRACLGAGVPLVEAGIEGFGGFVMSVKKGSACLGCLLGEQGQAGRETPVLGATAGVLGSIQAAECIKILLGAGQPLYGGVLYIDLFSNQHVFAQVTRREDCPVCGGAAR